MKSESRDDSTRVSRMHSSCSCVGEGMKDVAPPPVSNDHRMPRTLRDMPWRSISFMA